MQVATGTVIGGKVVVEGLDLEEGTVVAVLSGGANEPFSLTREDEDELLAAIAEIEAGNFVSLSELSDGLLRFG